MYAYTLDREPARITGPDGQGLESAWDSAGRMTAIATPSGAITYTYDAATGRVSTITAPGGIELAYTFDGPLLTGEQWAGAVAGSIRRAYDNDFGMTSLTIADGAPIAYEYDPDGLATRAGDLHIARDAHTGLVTGTTLGGVTDARGHNGFGEGVSYTASFGGAALFSQQHVRDALGRITETTETAGGVTAVYGYVYDIAGRLTDVLKDGVLVVRYTYDANGNRLIADDGVTGTYDDQDRLVAHGAVSYDHAAGGERVGRTVAGQTTSYVYDVLGNLVSVVPPAGLRIDYLVDGRNRRVGKLVGGVLVQGLLYQDGLRPVAELDGAGTVVARFVYGSGTHVPDYMVKGGNTYRIVSDHVGSPRLVVNVATGEVAQRMDFDAFGRVLLDTNPGFQPFGFAGGLYDRDTGLTRFGRRDYDAETGRWTARDPIGFRGGDTNLYAYAFSDPVNRADVGGAQPEWLVTMLGGNQQAAQRAYEFFQSTYKDTLKLGSRRLPFSRANYNYWLRELLQKKPKLLDQFKGTCLQIFWPFESLEEFFDYFQPFGPDPYGPPPMT
jgi:RHS repeat-associated protein